MWARCSLIISSRNFPLTFQASDAPEMSRSILGNATNIFKRASSVGEDALSVDTRYEKIRSLGRGSFGGVRQMDFCLQIGVLQRGICLT